VVKTGEHPYSRVVVPPFEPADTDYRDLLTRCRTRWAKRRVDVEREIRGRVRPDQTDQTREALHGWQ